MEGWLAVDAHRIGSTVVLCRIATLVNVWRLSVLCSLTDALPDGVHLVAQLTGTLVEDRISNLAALAGGIIADRAVVHHDVVWIYVSEYSTPAHHSKALACCPSLSTDARSPACTRKRQRRWFQHTRCRECARMGSRARNGQSLKPSLAYEPTLAGLAVSFVAFVALAFIRSRLVRARSKAEN